MWWKPEGDTVHRSVSANGTRNPDRETGADCFVGIRGLATQGGYWLRIDPSGCPLERCVCKCDVT